MMPHRMLQRPFTLGRVLFSLGTVLISLGTLGTVAQAQNLFAPVITVNDRVITGYEIEQRAKLLTVISPPVNPVELAREQLIEDRLKLQAADAMGLQLTKEGIESGMSDFAQRGNLKIEDLLKGLADEGIEASTLQDFVISGLVWRGVVQNRFLSKVNVSEAEIDRALDINSGQGGIRVLLSEIIVPITPQTTDQVTTLVNKLSQIRSGSEFEKAAKKYSASPTAVDGGALKWLSITDLPAPLRPVVMSLSTGEVSDPLPLQGAIGLFRLRGMEETTARAPKIAALDYAVLYLPGGRSPDTLAKAEDIKGSIDKCDDLYGVNFGQPEEALDRVTLPPAKVQRDIAKELSQLDIGEVSTNLTSSDGQSLVFLMLCGRTTALTEDVKRADVATALREQRIESYAAGYLSQLRAEAKIVEK